MGMKYYAKSKKNGLSDKERGKQIKEPEEEQKTLNSHQEDIVRRAEAFFEEYGRYFSEKEKRLVIESCRIHDWGKANLVFQVMINPELAGERKLNVKSISQIPHGHLSAVTLSQWTIVLRKMILGLLSRQSIITIREKTRKTVRSFVHMERNIIWKRSVIILDRPEQNCTAAT